MRVDVHGHITSPELFDRFPMPRSLGDIDAMVEAKAVAGIDLTVVGSPVGAGTMVPVPGLDNYRQSRDGLQRFHNWVAEQVRLRPSSLRAYVYVNPYATDGTLDDAADWLDEPEFVGIIANTSVDGRYLRDSDADGLFALAAERRVPVLLHPPAAPVGAASLVGEPGLVEQVLRPCDITAGVAAVLAGGWLDRYPDLMLIAPNVGGALPLLAEKLALADQRGTGGPPSTRRERPARSPLADSLRRVYVDTSTPSPVALAAALRLFGPDHLLFGTDSPPSALSLPAAVGMVEALDVGEDQVQAIMGRNAAALFDVRSAVAP